MSNEYPRTVLANKLVAFRAATEELVKAWSEAGDLEVIDTMAGGYPFEQSLDELAIDVNEWTKRCINKLIGGE